MLAARSRCASPSYAQTPAAHAPSADQLEQAIEQRWEGDATLKACQGCDLDVEATGDVVEVSGEVPTAALKARAARLANVRGVARVDNRIEIVTPRSATDTARAGANKAANKTAEASGHSCRQDQRRREQGGGEDGRGPGQGRRQDR